MPHKFSNWLLFIALSLIWGSSFILMKIGLQGLNAFEVAGIRLLTAGICMLPFALKFIKKTPLKLLPLFLLTGLLGNGFPAFLFCAAETKIDSSFAGILNALTPLFTLVFGVLLFRQNIIWKKFLGIIVGFTGVCLLFFESGLALSNYGYGLLIILATAFYGININIIKNYLQGYSPLHIICIAFLFLGLLSLPALIFAGLPEQVSHLNNGLLISMGAAMVLGAIGTALAVWLFYKLIQSSGPVFASMVTYGAPVVAIGWGWLAGENISWSQFISLILILTGVYLASQRKKIG